MGRLSRVPFCSTKLTGLLLNLRLTSRTPSRRSRRSIAGDQTRVYPLTIAPRITAAKAKKIFKTEQDFDRYLSGQKRDLNNDQKINYLDDYIVTANYLAGKARSSKSGR